MPKGVYSRVAGKPRPGARKRRLVVCANCGKKFERPQSNVSRKYCSILCYNQHYRGANHSQYHGGTTTSAGYILYSSFDGAKTERKGEHRIIAEAALGRRLNKYEVVHHINGNKADNRNTNLLICSMAYHQWLHMRMSLLYAQEHFNTN